MKTIYKYQLEVIEKQIVELPLGAQILTVQVQNGEPCIWAEVYNENKLVKRVFEIFGTGHELREGMGVDRKYIGTFQIHDGALVFHLYERL